MVQTKVQKFVFNLSWAKVHIYSLILKNDSRIQITSRYLSLFLFVFVLLCLTTSFAYLELFREHEFFTVSSSVLSSVSGAEHFLAPRIREENFVQALKGTFFKQYGQLFLVNHSLISLFRIFC